MRCPALNWLGADVSIEWSGANRIEAAARAPDRTRQTIIAFAALLLTALLISIPAALGPVRLNDSYWIDLVWLEQFAHELGNGVLYPRWLAASHGGLGSPVFYYYPPLAFYVGAAFVWSGLGTFSALIAAFASATLLSGVAVYLWLRGQSRAPLIGALLFMITPYQLFNFYQRGAIAEFLAAAIVPFVLLGIRRMAHKRLGGTALCAVSYAALIMSHLPLTLLASVFLFLPYLLASTSGTPQKLLQGAFAFALGTALAAVYLIPALALEQYRSSADLWTLPYLQPATWNLWSARAWADRTFRAVLLVDGALVIPAVGLIVRNRSRWAILAVVCLLASIGVVPVLWSLPVLQRVQFPFRLLPVAELAFVTAAACAPKERVPWLMICASFLLIDGFIITAKPEGAKFEDRMMHEVHPDVPENLPPGSRSYSWPSKWALDVASTHRQTVYDRKVTIDPVFYFPAWQVQCGGRPVKTFPDPANQLLAHEGVGCSRRLVPTPPERLGEIVSLVALLGLISLSISPWSLVQRRWLRRESPLRNT